MPMVTLSEQGHGRSVLGTLEPSGGGSVRENFLEEVTLREGAQLYLQPLSVVQRLGLSPLPAYQDHPNANPSVDP